MSTRLARVAEAAIVAAFVAVGYGSLLSSIPTEAKQPAPSGAIGDPITGTPQPTGWLAPAIHSHHHKHAPREHLTMPPTDTED